MKYEFKLQKEVLSVIWFPFCDKRKKKESAGRVKRTILNIISIIS